MLLAADGRFRFAPTPDPGLPGLALLGVHYQDPLRLSTVDAARANAVQLLFPGLRVIGVATHDGQSTPSHLEADFRSPRAWSAGERGTADAICSRGVEIFVLDYFWLQDVYLREDSVRTTNGYGNAWTREQIPTFLSCGGRLAILPNDRWGNVGRMVQCDASLLRGLGIVAVLATTEQAYSVNPLWYATAAAARSPGWGATVPRDQQQRTNALSHREYLDSVHPFYLFYKGEQFADPSSLAAYVRGKRA